MINHSYESLSLTIVHQYNNDNMKSFTNIKIMPYSPLHGPLFTSQHPMIHELSRFHQLRTEFQASTKESVVTWQTFIQAQPTVKDMAWDGKMGRTAWCLPCKTGCVWWMQTAKLPLNHSWNGRKHFETRRYGTTNQQNSIQNNGFWKHACSQFGQWPKPFRSLQILPSHCKRRRGDHEAAVGLARQWPVLLQAWNRDALLGKLAANPTILSSLWISLQCLEKILPNLTKCIQSWSNIW